MYPCRKSHYKYRTARHMHLHLQVYFVPRKPLYNNHPWIHQFPLIKSRSRVRTTAFRGYR